MRSKKEGSELAWTANAYLDCAIAVCAHLLEEGLDRSSHHFRVPLHLAHLAIELFFKAGLALEGKQYRRTHDLGDLRTAFEESGAQVSLPIPEDLERFIPKEFPSISTQRELFEPPPLQPVVQSSAWHFERLRYATDRQGKPFPDLDLPDIAHFKEELEQLQAAALKIMIRVWRTDDEE